MFKPIFLDIETIPTQRDDVKAYIANTVTHPGNISKAETLAKWNEESRPVAVEEAIGKTGLDGAFGQVVCVGLAIGEGPALVEASLTERDVLLGLNARLDDVRAADVMASTIVGHNVSAFDLRFLVQRYIVNSIRPHAIIARAAQAKPWEGEKVYDTMVQFAGAGNRISLDKLCLSLSLPGKGDISGKDVWPMVQAGKLQEVADYCASDVTKTRDVFKRMTFANVLQSAQHFDDVAA